MRTTVASLLLLSAVCTIPASANYFSNPQWGTMLNVGSAPNPTPAQLRAIGDSSYVTSPAGRRGQLPPRDLPLPPEPQIGSLPPAPLAAEDYEGRVGPSGASVVRTGASVVTSTTTIVVARPSVKEEKRITAQLNKASLMRAIASKATAVKATKTVATKAVSTKKLAAKTLSNKKTAVKGKPPVKAAANTEKKPRV